MRILFLTTGRKTPSSRFRVLQFVPHLRRLGHTCVVAPSHPPMYSHYPWLGWRPSQRLRRELRRLDLWRLRVRKFDLVYLERELFDDETWDLEARFRRYARTMLLDVDDAIFLRHPAKFAQIARICDGIVAGSRLLREAVLPWNPNVAVIPTCVDLDRYPIRPPTTPQTPVIGWTGTSSNLRYLELVAAPLRELAATTHFELRIIVDDPKAIASLPLAGVTVRAVRWHEQTEARDLHSFDIGIMPLPDTEWTRYKCGLKILQYMGVGIPAVASPVGVNPEIIRSGQNGLLADSPEEWRTALGRLLGDSALRTALGAAGRATVEQTYSVQAQLPNWLSTVEQMRSHANRT